MFGISLTEVAMIALVALVVVGPDKLPKMLRTLGEWVRKIRQMTTAVRAQTGIDDILREEGIDGGLAELRSLVRGDLTAIGRGRPRPDQPEDDPYAKAEEIDRYREYPPEGVDAAGALPDDLVDEPEEAGDRADVKVSEESPAGADEALPKVETSSTRGGSEPES